MDRQGQDWQYETDAEPADEQRDRSRDSLFLAARFRARGSNTVAEVRVRNLSSGGLMAELPNPVPTGTAIDIELRGIGWVAGRVAWTAVGRSGIAFDAPIDPLLARRPVGRRSGGN